MAGTGPSGIPPPAGRGTAAAVEQALALAATADRSALAGREAAKLVRCEALALAAVGFALRGRTEQALAIAEDLPGWRRRATLSEIVGALDRQGDAARAQQVAMAALAEPLRDLNRDLEPLLDSGLARYAYRPLLRRESSELVPRRLESDLFQRIAKQIAFDGTSAAEKLRHVRAAVQAIDASGARDEVLGAVAWSLTVQGSPEAVQAVRLLRDPAERSLALIWLTRARWRPDLVAALEEEARQAKARETQVRPPQLTSSAIRALVARVLADRSALRRAQRLRALRARLGSAPPSHAAEARLLIAEALAASERIRGFGQRSQAVAEAALELAHLRRFREARLACESCLPAHKLMVYTAILHRFAEGDAAAPARERTVGTAARR